jgi:signal transduction histidine kinase
LKVLQAESVRAVQSTPLLDRDGKVLGIVSTHFSHPHRPSENDIHFLDLLARQAAESIERDRADRALRQAKEELAKANRELDETVQRRTASLQEALSSLETLLYTIAHDLRTPNRAMQGYAHLLMTSHSSGLGEQELFFLQRIEAGALKNEALIRDLLEFGRLAHAEFPCHAISPVDSIRAVLQGLELEIKGKQAHVDVAPHWPEVVANDSALGHVLINLISNALKFNRPGVSPLVRIFPLDAGEYVRVCVQDNGIGVPKDQWETIFRPFHRASNANWEGTGMGLAIVRKAAERMGGRAGLESQLGEGSTFWIELRKTTDELPGASLRRG